MKEKNTFVSKRLHFIPSYNKKTYKIISMMEFLPKKYYQESTDLGPEKHYVIMYVMGLTIVIATQSNVPN